MGSVIDMNDMRNLNLFGRVTKVSTRFCFHYNNMIFFCVPKSLVSRAVGENGKNVKDISGVLKKKIRIIPKPRGIQDLKSFIEMIITPVQFNGLEISDNEVIITAGSRNKAALLGRNKRRFLEMQRIIRDFFGMNLRIV